MKRSTLGVSLSVLTLSVAGVASLPVSATELWQLAQSRGFAESSFTPAPLTEPRCTTLLPSGPGANVLPTPLPESAIVAELKRQQQQERDASKLREDVLRQRVAELEREVEHKNARMAEAVRVMNATRQELVVVKSQFENWSVHLAELRETVRTTESDNRVIMQSIIKLLEKFLQDDDPAKPQD